MSEQFWILASYAWIYLDYHLCIGTNIKKEFRYDTGVNNLKRKEVVLLRIYDKIPSRSQDFPGCNR